MLVIEKEGYFENGVYFKGLHSSMIGKKIIHVGRCMTPNGYDGSFCTVAGTGFPQDPKDEYVILRGIREDKSLLIEWNPRRFPGQISTLEEYWNDGNWVLYQEGKVKT